MSVSLEDYENCCRKSINLNHNMNVTQVLNDHKNL
jgi:hypothetical protein